MLLWSLLLGVHTRTRAPRTTPAELLVPQQFAGVDRTPGAATPLTVASGLSEANVRPLSPASELSDAASRVSEWVDQQAVNAKGDGGLGQQATIDEADDDSVDGERQATIDNAINEAIDGEGDGSESDTDGAEEAADEKAELPADPLDYLAIGNLDEVHTLLSAGACPVATNVFGLCSLCRFDWHAHAGRVPLARSLQSFVGFASVALSPTHVLPRAQENDEASGKETSDEDEDDDEEAEMARLQQQEMEQAKEAALELEKARQEAVRREEERRLAEEEEKRRVEEARIQAEEDERRRKQEVEEARLQREREADVRAPHGTRARPQAAPASSGVFRDRLM